MSWRSTYRSSKFRNVFGKAAGREECYEGVPITRNVHDNHFCAANPKFLAIITESSGGGSFLVIPVYKTGRIDPHHPKVCGHQGSILDIKWSPFRDNVLASCSEDCTVRIWEIPDGGIRRNMTEALMVLTGHSRRVGLIEWHPTCSGILYSAGYDGKIILWNLEEGKAVRMIDSHSDVVLCMSFNTDGSLLATSCKDKKLRIMDARTGRLLQEADCKRHRVGRVVFLGNMKRVLTTGVSQWNTRQVALWDQEDLSVPIIEEEIDGLSGLLFPFYDADTHMLYLAGKGDGNIRYYEVSLEKPYLQYLMEFSSPAPQKGLGVMPKRGLDVGECEVFRFYKLVTLKGLVEPISMIVPRRVSEFMPGLIGWVLCSASGFSGFPLLITLIQEVMCSRPVLISLKETYKRPNPAGPKAAKRERRAMAMKGLDLIENVSPKTDNEFLKMFYRQQDEIKRLQKELSDKDERIKQLELELHNLKNVTY
uniref:Coronin n=1 Tax=Astyanax mexicanus TaxID=7994 RepID=A0A8B9GPX4_ASTMX